MTVKELIEALSRCDPNARAVIDGFEGFGYDDVKQIEPVSLQFGVHIDCHHGEHEIIHGGQANAVYLS
ncbi:hypothetical protein EN759_00480 [Mesorhizobium sp. M00.F.Ca.ET.038.03.1.1]|nr:hypothetical protein EN759_00480 [Mesorhizobium sp. M00.F.Ca.ET.038.03.1.1]TIW04539.1 MAG: hypothetical protein E5V77_00200 [Mesorhizobium sp.]